MTRKKAAVPPKKTRRLPAWRIRKRGPWQSPWVVWRVYSDRDGELASRFFTAKSLDSALRKIEAHYRVVHRDRSNPGIYRPCHCK